MRAILRTTRAYWFEYTEYAGAEPEFLEWLKLKYGTVPSKLYLLCQATGSYGDYDKCMEWYRRRYRKEIEVYRNLCKANPFIEKQEDKNYGFNEQFNGS